MYVGARMFHPETIRGGFLVASPAKRGGWTAERGVFSMLERTAIASYRPGCVVFLAFCATSLIAQQKPLAAAPPGVQEFPITMQQNVAAGKTPVGTKIQARLEAATLVAGKVIPKNAVFSGEVIESSAKTKTDPSRLAIRMDSVLWKDGSVAFKAYLTAWYYPTQQEIGRDLQYGPDQPANRTWNGQGQYPDPNSKVYQPFPGDTKKDPSVPDTPSSTTSSHHVVMKDVAYGSTSDGAIALVSKANNLKLDKLTIYVLVADILPAK
jgi:hypothetical protein